MFQRRQQRQRCRALDRQCGGQPQELAGRGLRQRHAGGIVHRDVPARQLGGDTAGQRPVRRDQCRRAFRRLQRMTQQQRDHARLLLRGGAVDAADAGKAGRIEGGGLPPGLGRGCRAQRLGDQPVARGRECGGPVGDLTAGDAEMAQQPGQAELRMAFVGLDLLPGGIVAQAVEAGQHHHALRQAGDHGQQVAGRGYAAGCAGGDDGKVRRAGAPERTLRVKQPVAPLRRVQRAIFFQQLGPGFGNDAQEIQCDLPVLRIFRRHQPGQLVEGQPLGLHLIQKARQFGGQPYRLVRAARPVLQPFAQLQDQAREQQLPPQGGDCRRDVGCGAARCLRLALHLDLVGIQIAQRHHARQQQRPAIGQPQEGLAQGAAAAPGRHQDQHARQGQRIALGPRHQPGGQRVGEAGAGRNREDGGGGDRHHTIFSVWPARKASSVSGMSSGVLT